MRLWPEKNRIETMCAYEPCGQPIPVGEAVMVAKAKEGTAVYHLECWTKLVNEWMQVVDTLEPQRGRRKLPISDAERRERLSILRKYGVIKSRLANYRQRLE